MVYFPLNDTYSFSSLLSCPFVQKGVDTILVIQHACGLFCRKRYERCLFMKFMKSSSLKSQKKKWLKSFLFISDCYLIYPQSLTTVIHLYFQPLLKTKIIILQAKSYIYQTEEETYS